MHTPLTIEYIKEKKSENFKDMKGYFTMIQVNKE